jgi:transcriptional antiterminator RfaH
MMRWYLIHTKPAGERLAQANLERQGYEVYLPRLVESLRRGARRLERIVALFPRYLFLRLNEGHQALAPVRSSVGVVNVVKFGARYAIVADELIRELRSRADPVTGLHRMASELQLAPGTLVSVTVGLFDGLEGIFLRKAGGDRVVVLLTLLGQDAAVRIPADFILPRRAG